MNRQRIAAGSVLLALITVFGFVHERLFAQHLWDRAGLERFLIFSAAFWVVAALLRLTRPSLMVPSFAVFVFIYSTWWCWRFFVPWAPAVVVYFLGSCWMLGRRFAKGVVALIAGLAIWVFLISIAVHFRVNYPLVYAIAFAAPYFIPKNKERADISRVPGSWGMATLIYVLMAHWLPALGPEVSSDGLAMHLAIPATIAHERFFPFDFHQYAWALMPMGGDFAFTAVYLIGGEAAARLLNFSMLVLLAAMVYRVSQRWLPESKSALVAALFASTPVAQLVSGSLFVENVWAVFIAGSALALAAGDLAIGGMLLGAAFAAKVGTSAYLLAAVVIAGVNLKGRWRTAALATALFVAFAAPPYIYSFAVTRNPIFPFSNQIFKSPEFPPVDMMRDVNALKPPIKNGYYAATFQSSRYIEGLDGSFGFQYFLLLPAALILWNRKTPGALLAFGLTGALLSFVSLPNLRYLFPAMPLLSIGFAWLLAEIPWLTAVFAALLALNLCFFTSAGWYHKQFAQFTRAQVTEYKTFAAPQRELVKILNAKYPGQPIAFLRGEAVGELHAKVYSDTWHTVQFWRRMIESDSPVEVAQVFHDAGVKLVVTPIPIDSPFQVVRDFVNEWTTPTGISCGIWQLRFVLPTRVERLRDVAPAPAGNYDDRDWRIQYSGAWLNDRQFKKAWSGSLTYSNVPGDSFHFYFTGTAIDYVYTNAPNRGVAEVWIDRKKRTEIDQYSEQIEWQRRTAIRNLEAGPHTIEVRVTGRKNPASAGVYVDLDGFVVH